MTPEWRFLETRIFSQTSFNPASPRKQEASSPFFPVYPRKIMAIFKGKARTEIRSFLGKSTPGDKCTRPGKSSRIMSEVVAERPGQADTVPANRFNQLFRSNVYIPQPRTPFDGLQRHIIALRIVEIIGYLKYK